MRSSSSFRAITLLINKSGIPDTLWLLRVILTALWGLAGRYKMWRLWDYFITEAVYEVVWRRHPTYCNYRPVLG